VIRKLRKKRKKQTMVKSLQSGLILSTLLLWTSQQVGTTFGGYTSVREDDLEIKACRVFPSQIESQLSLLAEHLERAASLKGRLIGATDSVHAGGEVVSGFKVSSRLEAVDLSEQIGELNAMIQQLEQQKALNQSTWQELLQELAAASGLIHELLASLNGLESNCAKLSQTTLLDRITDLLKRHRLLSDPLSGTLQEILNYLRSVHQLGLMTSDSLEADSYAAFASVQPFDGRIAVDGDPVGGELLAYFESVQASLQSAIAGLTADISSLEAQRLAKIKRLKKLQEEQAGEDETAAPDEAENLNDGETPPPGDEQPAKGETPADGETPTVGQTGGGDVRTPVDGAPTGGGDSANKDEDEDKQDQADSADADAAPSSANDPEGGE
jgi:TolA-binding protein